MNTFEINTVYPFWWIIFCVIGGIIYAAFLYWYKNKEWEETNKFALYLLSFLRFSVVSILLFLLLEPFVKNSYFTEIPANVVVLQDNSQSIVLNKDSSFYKNQYPARLESLVNQLSEAEHLQVNFLTFGNNVEKSDSLTFDKPYTNIQKALKEVEELYSGQNLSAVVLATDGIYTRGQNPLYWNNAKNVKLYTLALGDTAQQRDALVESVFANDLVLLNNDFEVRFNLRFKQLKDKTAKVTIEHQGKNEFEKNITIQNDNFSVTESVILNATETGWQQYRVKIQPLDGETTLKNNSKTFFVKVIDARSKILLLAASPNPDVAALKRAIDKNKNLDLKIVYESDFNENLTSYSLIIAHQIPVNTTSPALMNKLKKSGKSIWFIVGSQTNAVKFNAFGMKKIPQTGKYNYVTPAVAENFNLFTVTDEQELLFKRVSPLLSPFGKPQSTPDEVVMLNQKIGQVTTDYPLLSFTSQNDTKYGYLMGEGIWRWRMQNYTYAQNFEAFDQWINNIVEYLSVKQDKSLLQISTKTEWNENENITFQAKLYNPAYELITTSDIDLTIANDKNEVFSYKMLKGKNDYFLDIGALPVGIYSYSAKATVQGKNVTAKGKFIVKQIALESINTQADYELLKKLANKNNGQFFTLSTIDRLTEVLLNDKSITATLEEQKDYQPLIHYKWILFLLIMLASIEWFLRKWNGNV